MELLDDTVADYVDGLSLGANSRLWYQLDGAPAHSVVAARQRLTEMFGENWIGRYGPSRWPARSPDLTPLDFFLWGYIKNEVYSTEVTTVEDLKIRIMRAFDKIKNFAANGALFRKVRNNIMRRCQLCIRVHGGHFENLKI
ncbi:unnamed protein product [Parnassius mnemosyne]|uniref:Transposase n=1 Tax=Parnassius mnemosyne TaxID=213953 RepID=A0AAV1KZ53_9NEOP